MSWYDVSLCVSCAYVEPDLVLHRIVQVIIVIESLHTCVVLWFAGQRLLQLCFKAFAVPVMSGLWFAAQITRSGEVCWLSLLLIAQDPQNRGGWNKTYMMGPIKPSSLIINMYLSSGCTNSCPSINLVTANLNTMCAELSCLLALSWSHSGKYLTYTRMSRSWYIMIWSISLRPCKFGVWRKVLTLTKDPLPSALTHEQWLHSSTHSAVSCAFWSVSKWNVQTSISR